MTLYISATIILASHTTPLSYGEGIAALVGAGVGIILCLLWLYRRQRLLSTRVRLMREALHNHDFTFRLPTDSRLPGERDLQATLNDMSGEIRRLLARSEVESWQRLTRVLTHEIMNSVAPIQSITQAYITSPLVKDTPLEEGMQAIHDTTRSLSAFVDSYRKLTLLQPADIRHVDLEQTIDNLKTLYPDMEWHINLDEAHDARTDNNILHQVTTNIVKNAIEAGAHTIDCRTEKAGDNNDSNFIRLLISNDGLPIPPEVAREIFIPFFTTKNYGHGIGLPLARQMMIACDGNLMLADKPVAGYHTTFVVEMSL